MELQVHVPHELPHSLKVPSMLTAALAVAGSQRQILACHSCRHQSNAE